jgi:hypothetical protein
MWVVEAKLRLTSGPNILEFMIAAGFALHVYELEMLFYEFLLCHTNELDAT